MDKPALLVAVKLLHYQGQQLLKEAWNPFCDGLRDSLRQSGFEDAASSATLLLFSFVHPYPAITAIVNHSRSARLALHEPLGGKPLPVQIIVHLLGQDDERDSPYRNPDAGLWELLPLATIHITRALKEAWEGLMAQRPLPACTFHKEGRELYALQMTQDEGLVVEPILANRALPVQGEGPPCFYCGMQSHRPGQCPSKLLSMEHNGLESVGYLSFEQLRSSHAKVFANPAAMMAVVAAGLAAPQIRKNPGLMVFVGFFDINRVYQIRFLWNLAFSRFSKWQSAFKAQAVQADNKNLQLGLDCLRVGKYGQAEEFLGQEYHSKSTKRFAAAIGLAFTAMEQQGVAAMRSHLEVAKALATQPKDRIYIDLLLTRFYDLVGELWKSRDIIRSAATYQEDCPEAIYRKLQLEAKGNFTAEASQLLRSLLIDHRVFCVAALMDPALAPIEAKVEDMLTSQFDSLMTSAQDFLAQATREIAGLELWFPSQEPELEAGRATLATLHKRLERRSYFDAIDVEHKAKALLATSQQLRERKLNELYDHILKIKAALAEYGHFWAGYRYKGLFKDFGELLLPLDGRMQAAGGLARENDGAAYTKAVALLDATEKALAVLNARRERMLLVAVLCDSAISFAKKLLAVELGSGLLAAGLVAILSNMAEGYSVGGLVELARDPLFQRKAGVVVGVVAAPLIALSWALASQLKGD